MPGSFVIAGPDDLDTAAGDLQGIGSDLGTPVGVDGPETTKGGTGDDTFYVDNVGDVITELPHQGIDTVHTTVSYALAPNVEILIADSDAGLTLRGNNLANIITGAGGNDHLNGKAGDDVLTGGLGKDTLTGGAGDDVFKYLAIGDSGPDAAHRDIITDFSAGDKIDLSAIDAIDGGGHDKFSFIGSGKFTAAGQVRVTTTAGGDTLIQANTGGTNAADFSILLRGDHALSAADFHFS